MATALNPSANRNELILNTILARSPFQSIQPKAGMLANEDGLGKFNYGPIDMKTFLNTPAGRALRAAIINKELDRRELIEMANQAARETHAMRERYLAYLVMGMMYRSAHAKSEKFFNEQEQIAQRQQQTQEKQLSALHNTAPTYSQQHHDAMNQAHEALSSRGMDLHESKLANDNALDYVKDISQHIENQFKALESAPLSDIKSHIDSEIETFKSQIGELDKALAELGNDKTNPLVKSTLFHKNSLNDALKTLESMQQAFENNKAFNAQGEPASTLKDIAYVVPADKKIVNEGDKTYLLNASDDLSTMGPEAKEKASQEFENLKSLKPPFPSLIDQLMEKINFHKDKTANKFANQGQALDEQLQELTANLKELEKNLNVAQNLARQAINQALNSDNENALESTRPTPKPVLTEQLSERPQFASRVQEQANAVEMQKNAGLMPNGTQAPQPQPNAGGNALLQARQSRMEQVMNVNPFFSRIAQQNAARMTECLGNIQGLCAGQEQRISAANLVKQQMQKQNQMSTLSPPQNSTRPNTPGTNLNQQAASPFNTNPLSTKPIPK